MKARNGTVALLVVAFGLVAVSQSQAYEYSGPHSAEVQYLLDHCGPWHLPPCLDCADAKNGSTNGQPEVTFDPNSMRDTYVATAVIEAWTAEAFAHFHQDQKALANGNGMDQNLQSANALCSPAAHTVQGGGATPVANGSPMTLQYWPCPAPLASSDGGIGASQLQSVPGAGGTASTIVQGLTQILSHPSGREPVEEPASSAPTESQLAGAESRLTSARARQQRAHQHLAETQAATVGSSIGGIIGSVFGKPSPQAIQAMEQQVQQHNIEMNVAQTELDAANSEVEQRKAEVDRIRRLIDATRHSGDVAGRSVAVANVAPSEPKLNAGDLALAEAHWRAMLGQHPNDAGIMSLLAGTLADRQKFDEAIRLLDQAIASEPENKSHYLQLGTVFSKAGDSQRDIALITVYQAMSNGKVAANPVAAMAAVKGGSPAAEVLHSFGPPEKLYDWSRGNDQLETWVYNVKQEAFTFDIGDGWTLVSKADWSAPNGTK